MKEDGPVTQQQLAALELFVLKQCRLTEERVLKKVSAWLDSMVVQIEDKGGFDIQI